MSQATRAAKMAPVAVPLPNAETSLVKRMGMAHQNLLSVWQERDYRAKSIRFKMLNQDYVVCNSPQSVRHVFLREHDNYDRKSPQMRNALEPLLGDGLFVSDGDLWRQRRRDCAPALSNQLLPAFTEIMTSSARETAEQWRQLPADRPVDMLGEMARLTARIIGRTVFGDDTREEEADQVVAGFTEYQRQVEQLDLGSTLGMPFLNLLGNPVRRHRTRYSARQVHDIIDRIIERRGQRPDAERFSLIDRFMQRGQAQGPGGKEGGCPFSRAAVRNEAVVMFMAGHETTANALTWTWYLLDHDREVMTRLQQELDDVLGGRDPTFDDVDRLPYTRAVFEEAMRLYPPVPLLSRQARAEDSVHNREVKPGTIMMVLPWLLHRHRLLWDDPDHFDPERFMPDQPRPDKFAYLPFSVGPRVCLGKRFGLYEGILCLATLAQHFTPRRVPEHEVRIECRLTLRPAGGMPMFLERRAA
ncbi:cytochrome P450 [Halomonas urumqiensis]|uniref:cytochrome P450 n=1 Tax=Halomonas urumqiensis TaxID=1684789 RepID=UPI001E4E3318|nr:cytochrome P450 [Halomonas urumqiensis]